MEDRLKKISIKLEKDEEWLIDSIHKEKEDKGTDFKTTVINILKSYFEENKILY